MKYLYVYTKDSDPSLEEYRERFVWQFDKEGKRWRLFYSKESRGPFPQPWISTRECILRTFENAKAYWTEDSDRDCHEITRDEALIFLL